ncbi:hypothetical protein A2U01_0062797, partial [Trifolium medium]|nr:hypothetical protein [Trifolium medium]
MSASLKLATVKLDICHNK